MNYTATFLSLFQMMDTLHTEEDCGVYWENMRWSPSITTNILRMGAKGYKFKDCRCRCIVRHGTMFEGSNLPLQKWFYAICLFLSCKKDKQLSVGERDSRYFLLLRRKCQRLNRHYRRPECLWHLYMRITDTRLSRTAGISINGLPLELDRGILESYQTRHKRHLLPCWRVIG